MSLDRWVEVDPEIYQPNGRRPGPYYVNLRYCSAMHAEDFGGGEAWSVRLMVRSDRKWWRVRPGFPTVAAAFAFVEDLLEPRVRVVDAPLEGDDVWLELEGGARLRLSDVVEFVPAEEYLGATGRHLVVRTRAGRNGRLAGEWPDVDTAFAWVDDLVAGRLSDNLEPLGQDSTAWNSRARNLPENPGPRGHEASIPLETLDEAARTAIREAALRAEAALLDNIREPDA